MNFGAKVKQLREGLGISQAELAKIVGITQSMLCQIERGTKTVSLPLSLELAEALGHDLSALLGSDFKKEVNVT